MVLLKGQNFKSGPPLGLMGKPYMKFTKRRGSDREPKQVGQRLTGTYTKNKVISSKVYVGKDILIM